MISGGSIWGRLRRGSSHTTGSAAGSTRDLLAGYPRYEPPHPGRVERLTDVQAVQNLDDLLAHRLARVGEVSRRLEPVLGLEVGAVLDGAPYEPLLAALLTWSVQTWPDWQGRSTLDEHEPFSAPEPVDGVLADLALLLGEIVLRRRPETAWTVNLYPSGTSGMVDERAPAVRIPPVGDMRYPHWFHATGLVRSRLRHVAWTTPVMPDSWRQATDDCVLGGAEEFSLLSPLTPNRQFSAEELAPSDPGTQEQLDDEPFDEDEAFDDDAPFSTDWRRPGLADLPDHRVTLLLRHDRVHGEGFDAGPAPTAAALGRVLTDQVRTLGADHPDALVTRYNIAFWHWRAGRRAAPAELAALEPELADRLGSTTPITRAARLQLSRWYAAAGAPDRAVQVLQRAADVPGLDLVHRLTLRHDLAHWTGVAGDPRAAVALLAELLPEYVDVLGETHFYTRNARWTAELWGATFSDA
jgi:hypothetical protein